MMRFAFVLLMAVHGLIHLLGFVKEWQLAAVEQLNGKTLVSLTSASAKAVGLLWLLAAAMFFFAALVVLLKRDWWRTVAVAAVLLSQLLIVLYWQDAKFGTIANYVLLVGILLAYGSWSFNGMVRDELKAFASSETKQQDIVTEEMLLRLPPAVQKWLQRDNVPGKAKIQTVHLKQEGEMRTSPEGAWMPVKSEQYFTVSKPGFIWIADVKAAPFMHLYGRDKYENGRGHMLIKLFALYPVADARGNEIDQGTLIRYLAETIWFPTAALSDYMTWEGIDATTAKATMRFGEITAAGIFKFDAAGDITGFEAQRFYDRKEGATLERWCVAIAGNSFRNFQGFRIPTCGEITWKLETGDFTWYRMRVLSAAYNTGAAMRIGGGPEVLAEHAQEQ